MQKVTPFLWFEKDAVGVAKYYQSIFGEENVTIKNDSSFDGTPSGTVQIVSLEVFDQPLQFMSAGKHDAFNDSISFSVTCKDQTEIDKYWDAITRDGEEIDCGWCRDKFGVRWQIVATNMDALISTTAGMQAMLKMKKIIIADLKSAANQK
jgi:predicted 3-demethylubiquinone-9 3-methyltransferase (glyoxalase superfamily)